MTIEQLTRRIEQLEREIQRLKAISGRAEIAGAVLRKTEAELPATYSAGRVWYVTDMLGGAIVFDDGQRIRPILSLASYLVSDLPTHLAPYTLVWASNGLNIGEVTGGGSGVVAIWTGTTWRRIQDGALVSS